MNSEYQRFLENKKFILESTGFEVNREDLNPNMFDFQKDIVRWALAKGRAAVFASCGLGKTLMQLEWADQICKRIGNDCKVLILAPLSVSMQTVREGEKFGISVTLCESQDDVQNGINITNYEKLDKFIAKEFRGVVLDESSILKSFTGKVRTQIIDCFAHVPYKLACTATPAPNDYMELGNHSEFLGVMTRSEMLSMFFVHDGGRTSQWRLKGHCTDIFWEWMASWAVFIDNPANLGYDGSDYLLPKLNIHEICVDADEPINEILTLTERRNARRESLKARCAKAEEIVNSSQEQFIVWCNLNDEQHELESVIQDNVSVEGATSNKLKIDREWDWRNGFVQTLISKPECFGYGMNWQHCHNMIFTGLSDCYDEQTEIMTIDGWKYFKDVTLNDMVATINPETQILEYQHPERVIYEQYEGDMIHFKNERSFDLLVTPNHKMFVKRPSKRYATGDDEYKLEYAEDLYNNYKYMYRTMLTTARGYNGEYNPQYVDIDIPDGMRINSRSKIVSRIEIDDYLRLIGWYVSEGYCRPLNSQEAGRIVISQTDMHKDNREEIIRLMEKIGLSVNDRTKDVTCYSYNLASHLINTFGSGSHNVHLSQFVKNLPSEKLNILRDTMLKGDGCHFDGRISAYRTASKQLAEDFFEICIKTNVKPTMRKVRTKRGDKVFECYSIGLSWEKIEPYISSQPTKEYYKGMIGCVTVPNHVVIVRRNGHPCVSGNSFEQYYQALRRCWRFGQTDEVNVYIIISAKEGCVKENIERKEADFEHMQAEMIKHTKEITKKELKKTCRISTPYNPTVRMILPDWEEFDIAI